MNLKNQQNIMSRIILFKAKRVDNGEWVEGKSLIQGIIEGIEFAQIEHSDFDNYRQYEVHPETVCQFTGLLDKNGAKIFELDRIKTPVGVSVVEFSNGVFGLNHDFGTENKTMLGSWGQEHNLRSMDDGYNREIEVIGNIHDKIEKP